MNITLGRVSNEDLARWQLMQARKDAMQLAPDKYSAHEIEAHLLASFRLSQELVERYGLDDTTNWVISQFTGVMYTRDD